MRKQIELILLLWFQIMEDCMVFTLAGCAITANCKLNSPEQLCSYSIELFTFLKFKKNKIKLCTSKHSCYNNLMHKRAVFYHGFDGYLTFSHL